MGAMKGVLLLSVLVTCVASSPLLGSKGCTWGPTYWCSSVKKAQECGAVRHCVTTVWKNQIIHPQKTAECDYCKEVVTVLKSLLASNATQDEIATYLAKVCEMLPNTDWKDQCKGIVTEYIPVLIQMLEQDSTENICAAFEICTGFEDTYTPYGVSAPNSDCQDCKKFFEDVQRSVSSNETVFELEQLINQLICSRLGTFSGLCNTVVNDYLRAALKFLASQMDPDVVCRIFGFCDSTANNKPLFLLPLKKNVFKGRSQDLTYGSAEECEVCKDLANQVDEMLRDRIVQAKVKEFLEDEVCTKLGDFAGKCKQIVEEYLPMLFELLVNELDPSTLCETLGMCTTPSRTSHIAMEVDQSQGASNVGIDGCEICEAVMKLVDTVLRENGTIITIEDIVDQICKRLTTRVLMQHCEALVRKYAEIIIKFLTHELDPRKFCTELGFCKVKAMMVEKIASSEAIIHIKEFIPDGESRLPKICVDLCPMCRLVVNAIETVLEKGDGRDLMESLAKDFCGRLATTYLAQQCTAFVEQNGRNFISKMSHVDPRIVCKELGMCTDTSPSDGKTTVDLLVESKTVLSSVKQSTKCQLCELAVQTVDSALRQKGTVVTVEDLIDKVCNVLPNDLKGECISFVAEYGQLVIDLLAQELDPKMICSKLGLCPASRVNDQNLVKELQMKVSAGEYCDICVAGISLVENLVQNISTTVMVNDLNLVCSILPGNYSAECLKYVKEYGALVIGMLKSKTDPKTICGLANLCTAASKTPMYKTVPIPEDIKMVPIPEGKTVPIPEDIVVDHHHTVGGEVSLTCEVCDTVLVFIKMYVGNNASKEMIEEALDKVCGLLPSEITASCDDFLKKYGPQLIDLLLKDLKPHEICIEIGLCKAKNAALSSVLKQIMSPKDTLPIFPVESKKVEKTAVKSSETTCEVCQLIVDTIENKLGQNKTEVYIKMVLESVCGELPGSLATDCQSLVDTYTQALINYLILDITPKQICEAIEMCPAQKLLAASSPVKLLPKPVHVKLLKDNSAMSRKVGAGPACAICEFVLNVLKGFLNQNSTQVEIETALERVCTFLPDTITTECNGFVKQYGPQIVELLLNNVKPEEICTKIKLCTANKMTPWDLSKKLGSGPLCAICEFIMNKLKTLLKQNSTQAEIEAALEEICSLLPTSLTTKCDDFVKEYGPIIVQLLLQDVNPDQICSAIGLCSASKMKPSHTFFKTLPDELKKKAMAKIGSSPECVMCEFVMKALQGFISRSSTEAEIEAALEKVCSVLPASFKTDCDDFVEKYGPMIVKLLVQEVDPTMICSALGLCSGKTMKPWGAFVKILPEQQQHVKVGVDYCIPCKLIITELKKFLVENRTEAEVEKFLDEVCDILPDTVTAQCHDIVSQYTKAIIDLLKHGVSPDKVCEEIGLCKQKMDKSQDSRLFFQPHVAVHKHNLHRVLGSNKCTWGPSHWCASKENAFNCQATQFCKEKVWAKQGGN